MDDLWNPHSSFPGHKNSQCRRIGEKLSTTRVIGNPASPPTTLEVEVHGVIEDIDRRENKNTAVMSVSCRNSKEIGGTETVLQLVPRSTGRGRKTLEIASFDNVFAPYIKPPT